MDILIKAAQLILSLSILVVLHELGHFIPARIFKTRVEKFYLFFNPWFSLFKKKIGDTEWGIGWLPLGGYVKIAGMVDESMDKEQLAQPAQPWEFRSKPAWQRLIIMVGGVTVNLLLGIVIYIFIMFTYGEEKIHTKDLPKGLTIHPYLEKYDLHSGDNILKVNGKEVSHLSDINNGILLRGVRKLTVQRPNGTIENLTLPEEIDYELFQEGAFPAVGLRHESVVVEKLTIHHANTKLGTKKSDIILSIDGKTLKNVNRDSLAKQKTAELSVLRGKDTITTRVKGSAIKQLWKSSSALEAGLVEGDRILSIGDRKVDFFDNIVSSLYFNRKKEVSALVLRNNSDTVTLNLKVDSTGQIGFAPKSVKPLDMKAIQTLHYSFGQSIGKGIDRGFTTLSDYVGQLKFLFTSKGASSIGGFGTIGNMFPPVWDWQVFWLTTAFISIILAFMNILPIPALDGGHVVFLLYEMITGREAPQKVLEYAQYVGFMLLLGLILYANGNDIYRWIFGA
jgi:regulator of sigma E protease